MEQFLYSRTTKNPKLNVWFAFPAVKSFALSSLGFLSIFKKLDIREDVFAERIYTNTKETKIHISDLDVLGFSTSFEIDILSIMEIFEKYNIPLNSKDRDENCPIVFAGGPVLSANPMPFCEFYDFISIGDSQNTFDKIFDILVKFRNESKEVKLQELNKLDCVWVPKFGKSKIIKGTTDVLKEPLYTPILSDESFFKNTFIIEIERGCPKKCNFCIASYLNLPARFVDVEKIKEAIDIGLTYTNKIALLGAYVAGHPNFEEILEYIREKNKISPIELTLSSLRADLTTETVIKTLVECGQKTATIAIEAGSDRLRKVINKDLTKEQILKTVETARLNGLSGLKAYMMIGHPTETKEDIEEFISLAKEIKQKNKGFDVTYSLATFIPKAQTPFQWAKREDTKSLEDKIAYLKKELHKLGITLRPTSVQWDDVQAILSRYGDSLYDYFIEVKKRGANLGAFKHVWKDFAKNNKFKPYEEACKMPFDINGNIPWNFIQFVDEAKLLSTYKKAIDG
ncbi:MAG: radical SAM protein [Cyanobacteria bacterium SIG30]|nr:radical SAM protein [Cyanobacteria bacterium SIG30]